ncbi:LapA family protein [Methylophaga sp.]|jgi:putative membrane protein|uniref:LapA family protein n=1 Tax=Methylophaga sp. TaxID=2024840 RepID=UPI0025E8E9FC|nr:LapA family protein [Methylophaga sp.]
MRKIFFLLLFALIFIFSAAFAAFNMTAVTVNFYFGEFTLPLSALLVIAMLLGVTIGMIVLVLTTLKLRYENRRLQHRLSVSEQEINSLRILPIKDSH